MNTFALRAAGLTEDRPELAAAVTPLLKARMAIEQQIAELDRKVMKSARNNAQVRQFMTAPGIGPITALCFLGPIALQFNAPNSRLRRSFFLCANPAVSFGEANACLPGLSALASG
jgi:transposase